MGYPTVSAPYGFKPINRVDGMPYAGATRQLPIDPTKTIYNGDLIEIVAGQVIPFLAASTGRPAGVFMGAQYENSMGQTIAGQYYPAGAANGIAYIVDDSQAAFKVAVTNSGSVVVSTTLASAVGANVALVDGTGNATTGDSGSSVLAGSEDDTATLPLRVIDVVQATATTTGYPEIIVKINNHQYNNATGVV